MAESDDGLHIRGRLSRLANNIGPGALVAAAFIGPGTVVTASLAGANYGYALLWALLFSLLATLILQEMAARLGVVTQQGLGENIRSMVSNRWLRFGCLSLVLAAVVVGNGAYQGGNLTGASLGAAYWTQHWPWLAPNDTLSNPLALVIGGIAFLLLVSGSYRVVERVLIVLVVAMSAAFIVTFVLTEPDWQALLTGLSLPTIPTGAALTVVALIGTTVVPYNLFLHASTAATKWRRPAQLAQARRDLYISIPLGGLISMAVLATAASAYFGHAASIHGAADLALSLQPLFGDTATLMMSLGLFAAGITSALTAPLASAYALSGILGYPADLRHPAFKATWMVILAVGMLVASLGLEPVSLILFAQVANGLLLPVICAFLLRAVNHPRLGEHVNSRWQNLLGGAVLLLSIGLGARSLFSALF
ncbi:natural resistance-associated macrophage protein [Idiomarina xiamenensis 10-D-4]|uniref:Natural resistance-associated macrophage protein n=2 Tax=Idiomarina xiamenensis TaxID=1207041 RepID=K2L1N2_9GAMM|nr:natural resistance-associated macrophage protein [Idiomarina xiamenensis 10-D-4]